jgi:hypothetical protein
MKPPTRPRQDQSQSLIEKETVFKTQGQSYNMDDLIKSTLLKEPVLESIVPNIYEKVMTKAEVHLKNIITICCSRSRDKCSETIDRHDT